MTVAEAIKELRRLPQDAEIFMVKDWEDVEEGCLNDLYRLVGISDQVRIVEDGMDWKDENEIILEFENERATCMTG